MRLIRRIASFGKIMALISNFVLLAWMVNVSHTIENVQMVFAKF